VNNGRAFSGRFAVLLKTILGTCIVLGIACGWFGTMFRPEFEFGITKVAVETGAGEDVSSYVGGETRGLDYEDDWLAWSWSINHETMVVDLTNRSPLTLHVDWIRGGLRTIDARQRSVAGRQSTTMIRSGEKIGEVLYPGDYALPDTVDRRALPVDWIVPMMPGIATTDRQRAERFGREQIGKSLVVRVPVTSGEETRDYIFTVSVQDYRVEQIVGS